MVRGERAMRRASCGLLLMCAVGCSPPLELEAHSIEELSEAPGFAPWMAGTRLLAVDVTLTNRTGGNVPLSPAAFFLEPRARIGLKSR
jgi:hypothetical protein